MVKGKGRVVRWCGEVVGVEVGGFYGWERLEKTRFL